MIEAKEKEEEAVDYENLRFPTEIVCKKGFWLGSGPVRKGVKFRAIGVEKLGDNWAYQIEWGAVIKLAPVENFGLVRRQTKRVEGKRETKPSVLKHYENNPLFGLF